MLHVSEKALKLKEDYEDLIDDTMNGSLKISLDDYSKKSADISIGTLELIYELAMNQERELTLLETINKNLNVLLNERSES